MLEMYKQHLTLITALPVKKEEPVEDAAEEEFPVEEPVSMPEPVPFEESNIPAGGQEYTYEEPAVKETSEPVEEKPSFSPAHPFGD